MPTCRGCFLILPWKLPTTTHLALPMNQLLTRRELLRLALPAAVSSWPSSRLCADDKPNRHVDVLVIGAGISGLAAARQLTQQKYNVLVLEARDRIGGRSESEKPWGGVTLDMGASWIHGIRNNPIHELAQQNKIETFRPTPPSIGFTVTIDEYEDAEQDATERDSRSCWPRSGSNARKISLPAKPTFRCRQH